MVERTHGGILAGFVRIKTQHHLVHVTFDDARVVGGEGRALWRDDVLHPGHETRNQIKLPFANDGKPGVEDGALDLSRPKNTLLLVKMGVSGELTYLAVFSSPDKTRPLKPITCPARRKWET